MKTIAKQHRMHTHYNNILIISNGELIGDGLVKLPFVRAFRREFPDSHITWLARNGCVYANVLKDIVGESMIKPVRKYG